MSERNKPSALCFAVLIQAFIWPALSTAQTGTHDPSPHKIHVVTVEKDVRLEVLDWGGTGTPVVLLAGLGNTAHAFDDFAPKLTKRFHVYGITRRGFGNSSVPLSGYGADRLGDDIIAVLDSLHIDKPVLIGHSIAGEELSSIGTRFPEKVRKLVYLEAAKPYAFYDAKHGDYLLDIKTLSAQLDSAKDNPYDSHQMETLQADLSMLQQSLHSTMQVIQADRNAHTGPSSGPTEADLASFAAMQKFVSKQLGGRLPEAELRQTILETAGGRVGDQKAPSFVYDSIINGEQKYKATRIPVLVIEALPPNMGRPAGADTAKLAADRAIHTEKALKQLQAFQAGNPSARIIKIPNAYHYIYLSNEAEVLKAISEFMDGDPVQH